MDHPQAYPPPPSDNKCPTLCKILFVFLIFIMAAIGLAILIAWASYYPQDMQISVSSASLSELSFNSSSSGDHLLTFNLLTNLTFRNPNKHVGIYYDWLEVNVDYNGVRFSWAGLPVFYQRGEEVREVAVEFDGLSTFGGGGGNVRYRRSFPDEFVGFWAVLVYV